MITILHKCIFIVCNSDIVGIIYSVVMLRAFHHDSREGHVCYNQHCDPLLYKDQSEIITWKGRSDFDLGTQIVPKPRG